MYVETRVYTIIQKVLYIIMLWIVHMIHMWDIVGTEPTQTGTSSWKAKYAAWRITQPQAASSLSMSICQPSTSIHIYICMYIYIYIYIWIHIPKKTCTVTSQYHWLARAIHSAMILQVPHLKQSRSLSRKQQVRLRTSSDSHLWRASNVVKRNNRTHHPKNQHK